MSESNYLQRLVDKAAKNVKTIVLPEGEDLRVLEAAHIINQKKAAKLIVLGDENQVKSDCEKNGWDFDGVEIVNPNNSPKLQSYADMLFELRKDKGMTPEQALATAKDANYFGVLMVKNKDADGMVSGANHSTADTVRPALQIVKSKKKGKVVSSCFILIADGEEYILSDCAININPTDVEMADIAMDSAESAISFGIKPRVAMLSYSTYGSGKGESVDKVASATKIAKGYLETDEYKDLGIELDGELQVDAALDDVVAKKKAPASKVAGKANVLIFPNIDAGNIGYKLLQRLGHCEAYGPMLQGLNAPINDLSRGALVEDIVGTIAITSLQAK
ncbi:MAG: phosphate acetyltransferase [Lactobacillus sp.]|jgi:phosphate acetyltransferase|nr:phosphate acetyltransferase [Lactobacillus sp.]